MQRVNVKTQKELTKIYSVLSLILFYSREKEKTALSNHKWNKLFLFKFVHSNAGLQKYFNIAFVGSWLAHDFSSIPLSFFRRPEKRVFKDKVKWTHDRCLLSKVYTSVSHAISPERNFSINNIWLVEIWTNSKKPLCLSLLVSEFQRENLQAPVLCPQPQAQGPVTIFLIPRLDLL